MGLACYLLIELHTFTTLLPTCDDRSIANSIMATHHDGVNPHSVSNLLVRSLYKYVHQSILILVSSYSSLPFTPSLLLPRHSSVNINPHLALIPTERMQPACIIQCGVQPSLSFSQLSHVAACLIPKAA